MNSNFLGPSNTNSKFKLATMELSLVHTLRLDDCRSQHARASRRLATGLASEGALLTC